MHDGGIEPVLSPWVYICLLSYATIKPQLRYNCVNLSTYIFLYY